MSLFVIFQLSPLICFLSPLLITSSVIMVLSSMPSINFPPSDLSFGEDISTLQARLSATLFKDIIIMGGVDSLMGVRLC